MTQHVASPWWQWVAVCALGVGSFTIVTTELAPVGLLSQIGADLDKPASTVGLAVTLYAWIGAAAALLSATTLSALSRRPLLIGLMLLLAVSAIASGLAANFEILMIARVAGALAHGAFWAMIGTLGANLVAPKNVGLATSIIFGGVSAASVAGVPLASYLGSLYDWKIAFVAIGALSLAVALSLRATVPPLPGQPGIDISVMRGILANARFQRIFIVTILSITAHFMAFTYIEPYLRDFMQATPGAIALFLFTFAFAGLVANVLCGALVDEHLKALIVCALAVSTLALGCLCLPVAASDRFIAGLILFGWGGAVAVILVGLQTWIIKEAGNAALPASAIYVALFNAAIGLGATLGSMILAAMGLVPLFFVASAITGIALMSILALREPESHALPAE